MACECCARFVFELRRPDKSTTSVGKIHLHQGSACDRVRARKRGRAFVNRAADAPGLPASIPRAPPCAAEGTRRAPSDASRQCASQLIAELRTARRCAPGQAFSCSRAKGLRPSRAQGIQTPPAASTRLPALLFFEAGSLVRTLGAPRSEPPCACYPRSRRRAGVQQQLHPASKEARHEIYSPRTPNNCSRNGRANAERIARDGNTDDFKPVVKLFCPWGAATGS